MTGVQAGAWAIESVHVNSEPVMHNEGFRQLIVSNESVAIEPAGIEFSISQATSRSAIFESRSQVFFAEYRSEDDKLTLSLTRPSFSETVRLSASR